ncbi:PTB domain-containing engulfment adapter protein 1, partial [Caligus rogercresseyi]
NTEVDKPKGIEVVKQGIQKLKFNQQIKKSEGNAKTPKVELSISVDGVAIQDPKSKEILHQYALHKISYCADDKAEKGFSASLLRRENQRSIPASFLLAFELAYKKFLDTSSKDLEIKKQLLILQKRVGILENENSQLKKRLKDVADIKGQTDLKDLCTVGETPELTSGGDVQDGDGSSSSDNDEQLICLDVNKLEGLSLDDLNDDDFNPREGDSGLGKSSESPLDFDFNPEDRKFTPKPLPALPPRGSPSNNNNNAGNLFNESAKNNNPFSTPLNNNTIDPFGMPAFSSPSTGGLNSKKQAIDSFDSVGNFSLDELDPLKK